MEEGWSEICARINIQKNMLEILWMDDQLHQETKSKDIFGNDLSTKKIIY